MIGFSKKISIFINIAIVAVLFAFVFLLFKQTKDNFDFFSSERFNETISFEYQKQANFENFLAKYPKKEEFNDLCFVIAGDLMPSRGVGGKLETKGCDYVFKNVKKYLQSADYSIVNLESPISNNCPVLAWDTMEFCSKASVAKCLKQSGISIASLANNHMMNFSEKGLQDTIALLESENILHLGAGENLQKANSPLFIEKNGIKIAFLAYTDRDVLQAGYEAGTQNYGVNPMDLSLLEQGINDIKEKSDFIVILMHSGTEYEAMANKRQIEFAHKAIDLGADLVLGHHPHVIQNAEVYKNKYIFYSLGNFVFDQMWSSETRRGLIGKICFNKNEMNGFELFPARIDDFSQPNIEFDTNGEKSLERVGFGLKNGEIFYFQGKYSTSSFSFGKNQKLLSESNKKIPENDFFSEYKFENGILQLIKKNNIVWKSRSDWFIDDFEFLDLDNDKIYEIVLSLWKAGSFGKEKPSWEQDDPSVKNHLFVFEIKNSGIFAKWQSSALKNPNCKIDFADFDNDSNMELFVLEGEYNDDFECNANYYAVWEWNKWGFENIFRSQKGEFSDLKVYEFDKPYGVVDTQ